MRIDYWYFNNLFNKKNIKEINNFIDKNFECFEDEKLHATTDNKKIKFATVKQITWNKIKHFFNDIEQYTTSVNQMNFGYNIYPINDVDTCNLNIYSHKDSGQYDWHTDESDNAVHDLKLTVLINLSVEQYSGGDFKIFNRGREYEVKELNTPGNVVIFKSFLNHKVSPVLTGERRTLAIFLKGKKFR
jgi:PKHD-type hydroxylase